MRLYPILILLSALCLNAIAATPTAQTYIEEANQKLGAQDYAGALTACELALSLDPRSAEAWGLEGLIYSHQGNYAMAVETFTQYIDIRPGDSLGYLSRGQSHYMAGHPAQALPDLQRSLQLDGDSALANYLLGRTLIDLDRSEDAVKPLQQAIMLDKKEAEYPWRLGDLYACAGQPGRRRALFDGCLPPHPR